MTSTNKCTAIYSQWLISRKSRRAHLLSSKQIGPIFAFNTLYHKRPKDAQPQDEIMRSEGLGFFPTSGRNACVLTRALLANLQSGYRFALLAGLYCLFP